MHKKSLITIAILLLISIIFFSIILYAGEISMNKDKKQEDKLEIIATIFPEYDFTRQIVKDKANVTMLLPAGTETHSYEPTPKDIIAINKANLFIYTGEHMETWAHNIINSLDEDVDILDVSKNIQLGSAEHEEHQEDDEEEHTHEYDPHIWTSPINAIQMCNNILDELCKIDKENAEYYRKNAREYINKLRGLDSEIRQVVGNAKRNKIVSGSRFPFYYFVKEYGIEYIAAYDSCNTEAEPSARVISNIIDVIKNEQIPVVYYEELSEPVIARAISNETGAKMLLLHSAHTVSKEEFESGITYLDIMKSNIENLKEGLN